MAEQRGKLIVFEGIDGTGKSTQVRMLAEWLRSEGRDVLTGFEPTNGPFGKKLRESGVSGRLTLEEEVELFMADRRQHVAEVIEPALEGGRDVVLDRYYFSTMAYQGSRGMDVGELRRRNEEFAVKPDVVFWLDLPVDEALLRIRKRGEGETEFEKRDMLERCREIFAGVGDAWFLRIDASGDVEEIAQRVRQAFQRPRR